MIKNEKANMRVLTPLIYVMIKSVKFSIGGILKNVEGPLLLNSYNFECQLVCQYMDSGLLIVGC